MKEEIKKQIIEDATWIEENVGPLQASQFLQDRGITDTQSPTVWGQIYKGVSKV